MSVQNVTDPMLLDSTGQRILTALQGIKDAVQPTNVYLDLAVSLPSSGWSNSSPYVYTWTSAYVTPECAIDVHFGEGAENILVDYLEFEKVSGGVKFTAPVKPTVNIPVIVRILNADAESITSVSATMVSTSAVSGQSNVEQALSNVDSRTTTNSQAIATINSNLTSKMSELRGDWNTPTTASSNTYATVKTIDIRNISTSLKVLFVRAIYYSGQPSGIKIGTRTTYGSGNFSYVRTFEPSNYTEIEGGTFVVFASDVEEVEIQQKFSSSNGIGYGQYLLCY